MLFLSMSLDNTFDQLSSLKTKLKSFGWTDLSFVCQTSTHAYVRKMFVSVWKAIFQSSASSVYFLMTECIKTPVVYSFIV